MSRVVDLPVVNIVGHHAARVAQEEWAAKPLVERLRLVRRLRRMIADNAVALATAAAAPAQRPVAEKLTSEVLPLVDACRWLERESPAVLRPRRHGRRHRPLWLHGSTLEVHRQPFGLVLVIGPGNYPLFLPAVHALHALVAGNAVLLKPAPGTRPVIAALSRLIFECGLDPALFVVLPDTHEAARDTIASGVDKVIFTGSSENGRTILAQLAETNTPSVMELSGCDPLIVLADADLDLVVRALRFGRNLNGGNTCIAPRRLIVLETCAGTLQQKLAAARLEDIPPLEVVATTDAAVAAANAGRLFLGASVFSRDVALAHAVAQRIRSGFVTINDLIVPTADPRMPFNGVGGSGFGSTRGAEGLLEMTFPRVIALRRGRVHPHFESPDEADTRLFAAYLRAAHGSRRLSALGPLLTALWRKLS